MAIRNLEEKTESPLSFMKTARKKINEIIDFIKGTNGAYKVYEAFLTQAGTDAPVATVLGGNGIGTIVWSYSNVGQYIGTLSGAFPSGKTVIELEKYNPVTLAVQVETYAARASDNTILVSTYNLDFDPIGGTPIKTSANNGGLTNSFIRVTVYN